MSEMKKITLFSPTDDLIHYLTRHHKYFFVSKFQFFFYPFLFDMDHTRSNRVNIFFLIDMTDVNIKFVWEVRRWMIEMFHEEGNRVKEKKDEEWGSMENFNWVFWIKIYSFDSSYMGDVKSTLFFIFSVSLVK